MIGAVLFEGWAQPRKKPPASWKAGASASSPITPPGRGTHGRNHFPFHAGLGRGKQSFWEPLVLPQVEGRQQFGEPQRVPSRISTAGKIWARPCGRGFTAWRTAAETDYCKALMMGDELHNRPVAASSSCQRHGQRHGRGDVAKENLVATLKYTANTSSFPRAGHGLRRPSPTAAGIDSARS